MSQDNDELQSAKSRYWLWKAVTMPSIGLVYIKLIAEGWRWIVPISAKAVMAGIEAAHILAIGLMVVSWWSWEMALLSMLGANVAFERRGLNAETNKTIVLWIAWMSIISDAGLFYISIVRLSWKGSLFSFPALLASVAYIAILLFISLISVYLRRPILLSQQS